MVQRPPSAQADPDLPGWGDGRTTSADIADPDRSLEDSETEGESDLLGDAVVALAMVAIAAVPAALIPWLLLGALLSWEEIGALYPESSWLWWVLDAEAVPIWVMLAFAAGVLPVGVVSGLFPSDPLWRWRQTAIALVAALAVLAVAAVSAAWALRVLDRL